MKYTKFLQSKIVVAEKYGLTIERSELSPQLLPHQKDIIQWAIDGGRRAIFASFGLGKTLMQLEIARIIMNHTGKPFLIAMPLAVVGEFKRDLKILESNLKIQYITDTDSIETYDTKTIYCTNYERVRKGDIDPNNFSGVSFDEASILRNLKTETTNYVLQFFKSVTFRFVATATPTPNDYIEILNYADFLGVISRGHALTRFFQRDSTKAGHLTLYENKKQEFWQWVASWAVFLNKPSDLGYSDEGYDLPKLNLNPVEVTIHEDGPIFNREGAHVIFRDLTKSLQDTAREKQASKNIRIEKTKEIVESRPGESFVLWHHLEAERQLLERKFKGMGLKSVYGSQPNETKEKLLIDFSEGEYPILATKDTIAGSGCNFQYACHNSIHVGINYKFNDFIQSIHRFYRFRQTKEVNVWVIFTQNEREVWRALTDKWTKHIELQNEMVALVKKYGLNSDKIRSDMKRKIFKNRQEMKIENATIYNNDSVQEIANLETDSMDMVLTSIPFGDHYEYSDNYNDFGHNHGNDKFFEQMDYLTPELLRVMSPGRIAAIHVKDRIRYSYQNGTAFTTISDFSGQTVQHFQKHGFYLIGKITVTTDVVRENNQTYRLGWTEQCKDASKMGVGLPEYILLFRKAPTEMNNGYSDNPIDKSKDDYTRANWQLDAHAYWRSNGNRFLTPTQIKQLEVKSIVRFWKDQNTKGVYDFAKHLEACEDLEGASKLSALFMTLPTHSNNDLVWTDVNRMLTLNAKQTQGKKEKHICPLQFDIIERLINRFSKRGETILDPFGGLFSTAYKAMEMGRASVSIELNPEYYTDGILYLKAMQLKINVPTLFDAVES
jgi:DNA modification methylase